MKKTPPASELLEWPCDYTFKAFGPNDGVFPEAVHNAVRAVVPVSLDGVRTRLSREGNYVCTSVLVRLHNADQLKAIYDEIKQVTNLKFLL